MISRPLQHRPLALVGALALLLTACAPAVDDAATVTESTAEAQPATGGTTYHLYFLGAMANIIPQLHWQSASNRH